MKKPNKQILAIAGVISTVLGIVGSIPSFLREQYLFAIGSTFLIVVGLVLLTIALGE